MKEKIIFPLVILLIIFIFSIFLVIAFKKDKAYLGGGLSVKKPEQPILFWSVIFLYVFIILLFSLLLSGFVFVNFIK